MNFAPIATDTIIESSATRRADADVVVRENSSDVRQRGPPDVFVLGAVDKAKRSAEQKKRSTYFSSSSTKISVIIAIMFRFLNVLMFFFGSFFQVFFFFFWKKKKQKKN